MRRVIQKNLTRFHQCAGKNKKPPTALIVSG